MKAGRRPWVVTLLLRAVGSVVVLAGLLVGIPVVLARSVGWPLPETAPDWEAVGRALGGASVSDDVLLKSLACATWALWALIVACFVAEAVAWWRGREAGRLAVAGLFQPAVRQLVMSAAVLIGVLRPAGGAAVTLVAPTATLAHFVAQAPPSAAPAERAVVDGRSARPSCLVKPRDSLWKLAERHLGDGRRWREIWELNRAGTFPEGRMFSDPNLIHPGWALLLPDDAVGLEATEEVSPPTPPVDPASEAQPLVPPAIENPAQTVPPTVPTPQSNAPATPASPAAPSGRPDDPDHAVSPLLVASALVSAGVIATLTGLRRRQQRHRQPGRMIRLPSGTPARTEVHLRRAAVSAPFDRLDLVRRALAHCLGRRRAGPCPAISVLSVSPAAIEVLLTEPADAPSGPFEVAAGGRAWTVPAEVPDDELAALAKAQSGPAPTLVTVGTVEDRTVFIDLEAGARTIVGGDPDDARAMLWTMAIELATSNRADDLSLMVVGLPPPGLDVLDRVQVLESLDRAIAAIEMEAAATTAALTVVRRSSTFDARACDPTLLLTPTVVVVADPPGGPAFNRLLAVAAESHGLAVLALGVDAEAEFDRELCVEGETMVLKPLGLRLHPALLPAEVVRDVGELLSTAMDLDPGPPIEADLAPACRPPTQGLTIGPEHLPIAFGADGNPVLPAGHVLVRVLGPVEILGSDRPIDRRRCVELVAYLALHPEGVDEGRIKAALWPEAEPTRGAFNETVSRARRLLGLDPTGVHHLRPVDNRRYRLGPFVTTDADLLQVSKGSADALRLVRGLPFEGTGSGYEWAYEEGHAYRLSAIVEEVDCHANRTGRMGVGAQAG